MKILLAQGARLDWRLRLTYIAYLEALADKHPDLVNRHQGPGIDELKKEMGDDADLGAFLANVGVSAIENPDELSGNALETTATHAGSYKFGKGRFRELLFLIVYKYKVMFK